MHTRSLALTWFKSAIRRLSAFETCAALRALAAMGTASSGAAEQAAATSDANELLRTLTGKDHIDTND
eukprot:6195237-Pleurochrysis_carterae.AAC.3